MTFVERLCEDRWQAVAEQLDAMLADDPRARESVPRVDDPLERAGARYARLSDAYLVSRADYPFEMTWHPSGPTPVEVFAWFHVLIAAKIYRALSCAARAHGDASKEDDAHVSAKVALIGIDRSLDSLAVMSVDDDDARLELLGGQLRRLRREVEGRFPAARAIVRVGVD